PRTARRRPPSGLNGRDGCRVPLPWEADAPAYGFNDTGLSWLPQPAEWATYARDVEAADSTSTLALYTELLAARREHGFGTGSLVWEDAGADAVAFRRGDVHVIANLGTAPLALPAGATVVLRSQPFDGSDLPVDTAVWYTTA
ncbi:MAG: DUF3459 domain-containing protein, partial [Microbacterium sp.]|nr:DUF3459 domain-containing protein [Microbacterium sp.]